MRPYLKGPAAIYAESFATVAREARLDRFPEELRPLVTRVIHACGMTDLPQDVEMSDDFAEAGVAALKAGRPSSVTCTWWPMASPAPGCRPTTR